MNKVFSLQLAEMSLNPFFSGQPIPLTVAHLNMPSATLVCNSQATGYGVMALITTNLKELILQSTTQCQNDVLCMMMLM